MEYGLSLGSNLGDRLAVLTAAVARIAAEPDIAVTAVSRVYETDPVDVRPEFADVAYLNAVIVVETAREPDVLGRAMHVFERDAGRVRGEDRNAPRPLDIDIIYAGALSGTTAGGVQLPHPRWAERRFVVAPLAEVRPGLRLPGQADDVRGVLALLPATPGARVFTAATWAALTERTGGEA